MNAQRIEHAMTDKGYVPLYATGTVPQPWETYSASDHAVWQTLFTRQRRAAGRARLRGLSARAGHDGHGRGSHSAF